jgi:BlaI family transcriptional regulator, penicillinase repressor
MAQRLPEISESEWDVMNVLWAADAPLAANEVVERLAGVRDWSPRTVKTLLNRLINKGALAYEAQGKRYLYRPRVPREQCVREETRSFLSRVFANAPGAMLLQFVAQAKLTPDEVEALRKLLDKKGK